MNFAYRSVIILFIAYAMQVMCNVQEITSLEQLQKIMHENNYVIIKCYSPTCPPCQAFSPNYSQASLDYPFIRFLQINMSRYPVIAKAYDIRSLPSTLFFQGGVFKGCVIGKKSLLDLKAIISLTFSL